MKKLTTKEFTEKLEAKYPGEYEVLSEYTTSKGKITVKHIPCGTTFSPTAKDLLASDSRCPHCFKSKLKLNLKSATDKLTTEKAIENLQKKYPDKKFKALSEYKGYNEPFKIECDGVEFNTTMHVYANKFSFSGRTTRNKKDFEEFLKNHPEFTVLSKYTALKSEIKVKHSCGHEFTTTPIALMNNQHCPACKKESKHTTSKSTKTAAKPQIKPLVLSKPVTTVSSYTSDVLKYIKSIYPNPDAIIENFTDSKNKHLDIYIPEMKVGINCNTLLGASEENYGKRGMLSSMLAFHDDGVRVVNMFADEWLSNNEITKDKLAAILHCPQKKSVYARKCTIRDNIDASEKNRFLDEFHVQGKDSAGIKCGLYDGDELVAVMTFAKPRKCLGARDGGFDGYELSRFAAKYNVIGGFSKLFKHIIETYKITTVRTYADMRWSSLDKNVYSQNGFTLKRQCEPGYWYFKDETARVHRFNFRKQELSKKFPNEFDPSLTEFQIMDKTCYKRVWDCGNMVYEYHC